MKKTYITPTVEEIHLEKALMDTTSSVQLYSTQELGDSDAEELLSRQGRGFWDDEDEY